MAYTLSELNEIAAVLADLSEGEVDYLEEISKSKASDYLRGVDTEKKRMRSFRDATGLGPTHSQITNKRRSGVRKALNIMFDKNRRWKD